VLSWLLALAAGGILVVKELLVSQFTGIEWHVLLIATGVFVLRLLLFWGIVGRISYRLAHTVHWGIIPFIDALLATYYSLAGLRTVFRRKQKGYRWR